MGSWGVAIFSDDVAETVRFHFKDLIGDGYSVEQATQLLVEEYAKELDEEDDLLVFWLSLAAIQSNLGRLQDNVKANAIRIIDNESELKRWEKDPKLKTKRKKVLSKLKEQLTSPQPPPKNVPKRYVQKTNLKIGDTISYQLLSGNYIILKVVDVIEEWQGDTYPEFLICDWKGEKIPERKQIDEVSLLNWRWGNGTEELKGLKIFRSGKRDYPEKRISHVAEQVNIEEEKTTSSILIHWKEFDETLEKFYNLK